MFACEHSHLTWKSPFHSFIARDYSSSVLQSRQTGQGNDQKGASKQAPAEDSGKEMKRMRFESFSRPEPKRDQVQLVAKARESRIQKEQFFHFCA